MMANLGKTWWGQRFIAALEGFTDTGRLQRGRSYASDDRILAFGIAEGRVTATVRGNVNPYFGVYKEPRYQTRIQMAQIPAKDWDKAIVRLGSSATLVAHLLMNEMPDTIDDAFADVKLRLLPQSRKDFAATDCSCPDDANPCKRTAAGLSRLLDRQGPPAERDRARHPGRGAGHPGAEGGRFSGLLGAGQFLPHGDGSLVPAGA